MIELASSTVLRAAFSARHRTGIQMSGRIVDPKGYQAVRAKSVTLGHRVAHLRQVR